MRIAAALLALLVAQTTWAAEIHRTVVVVGIDGFPASLLQLADTPHFDRLLTQSAWSDRLIPSFPSLSSTNWASLTTGCWPERHGIVSNAFEIDGKKGTHEQVRDADTLLECQPIHDVAESQGVPAATLGWTGSTSTTRGELASVVMPTFETWTSKNDVPRAEQVGELLALSEAERPRLILAYMSGPDMAEHRNGMTSAAAREAIEDSDRAIGVVLEHLEAFAKTEPVTLFVVTDHGMMDISGLLNVTKLLDEAGVAARSVHDGPIAILHLDDPSERPAAIAALEGSGQFDVVRPEAQPPYWRMGNSERLGDLILYAKPGWFFPTDTDMPGWLPTFSRWWPASTLIPAWIQRIGMHGYAIEDAPEMAGLFVAWGSGIDGRGKLESEVRAIDLHPTVARLLWIQPGAPHDGRVIEELLSNSE